jgi:hypothetical protein
MGVLHLNAVRAEKDAKAEKFRAELMKLSAPCLPGGQCIDPATNLPRFDAVAEKHFTRMFEMFGVSKVRPEVADFSLVLYTWRALADVGLDLAARVNFKEAYTGRRSVWKVEYLRYLEALWGGDQAAIAEWAKALGIEAGVPSGKVQPWADTEAEKATSATILVLPAVRT